ncbi:hypothetical protein KKD70_02835, partial [Patescibacteria group bacterium]|nr:hypothetical protein [Patescibacteria group bacterium]
NDNLLAQLNDFSEKLKGTAKPEPEPKPETEIESESETESTAQVPEPETEPELPEPEADTKVPEKTLFDTEIPKAMAVQGLVEAKRRRKSLKPKGPSVETKLKNLLGALEDPSKK